MSKKSPPKFKGATSYTSWKNKIEMWALVTSIPKKEQAIVVLLEALDENIKAEKAVSELTASNLNVQGCIGTCIFMVLCLSENLFK